MKNKITRDWETGRDPDFDTNVIGRSTPGFWTLVLEATLVAILIWVSGFYAIKKHIL